mgnify:CR=1 FL=1
MPPDRPAPLEGALRIEKSVPWRTLAQPQANFKFNQTKLGPDCGGGGVSASLLRNAWLSQSPLFWWEGQLAVAQWQAFGSMGPCFCPALYSRPWELWKQDRKQVPYQIAGSA